MKLLQRLAEFTKKPALRLGFVVLVDQGTLSLATFAAGVLVARASTQEDYALYVLGWSLLLTLKGVHQALVNLPVTVFAPKMSDRERETYQGSSLIHTVLLCILFGIGLLTANTWGLYEENNSGDNLFAILPVLLLVLAPMLLRDFFRNTLLAQLKVWASVRINVLATLVMLILCGILFVTGRLTFVLVFQLFAYTSIFAAGYMFWRHRKEFPVKKELLWTHFLKSWKFGKWALVNTMAYMASSQAYPWLILYFVDYESVAVFGACLAIAAMPGPLLRGASAYILPRMSHSYNETDPRGLMYLLKMSIKMLCLPYLTWLTLGLILNDKLVTLFYTDVYQGYGLLFILLLIMMTIQFVFSPFTSTLQALGRADMITVSLVIGAFVTLIIGSYLTMQFGLTGAGIAAIISISASTTWRWLSVVRITNHLLKAKNAAATNQND